MELTMFGRKRERKHYLLRLPEEIDRELAAEDEEAEEENRIMDPIEEGSVRAAEELREAENIMHDMMFGCVAIGLLPLLGLIWARPMWKYAVGVLIGIGVALYLVFHLYRSVSREVELEPKQAERYAKGRSALRYAIVLLAWVAVMMGIGRTAGIGCIFSVMSVKFSAYTQPVMRRIRTRFVRRL